MTNKIEGFIGCPDHGVFFRLESQPASNPGVFQHLTVALGDAAIGAKHCPVDGCGLPLERRPSEAALPAQEIAVKVPEAAVAKIADSDAAALWTAFQSVEPKLANWDKLEPSQRDVLRTVFVGADASPAGLDPAAEVKAP